MLARLARLERRQSKRLSDANRWTFGVSAMPALSGSKKWFVWTIRPPASGAIRHGVMGDASRSTALWHA